jgi:hypothetical protein
LPVLERGEFGARLPERHIEHGAIVARGGRNGRRRSDEQHGGDEQGLRHNHLDSTVPGTSAVDIAAEAAVPSNSWLQ